MKFSNSSVGRGFYKLVKFFRQTFHAKGTFNKWCPYFPFMKIKARPMDSSLAEELNNWHQYCTSIVKASTMKVIGKNTMEQRNNEVHVSFRNHGNLSFLNYDDRFSELKDLIRQGNKSINVDLSGVVFIDELAFDRLNLLSRLGRKYGSYIRLTNVEPEVMDLINLAKKYSVFDIRKVEAVCTTVT